MLRWQLWSFLDINVVISSEWKVLQSVAYHVRLIAVECNFFKEEPIIGVFVIFKVLVRNCRARVDYCIPTILYALDSFIAR